MWGVGGDALQSHSWDETVVIFAHTGLGLGDEHLAQPTLT